jgi:hypothetical protein
VSVQDKLARTESACESLQAQYDALHDTTSMLVRHAIAVGDQTVACALAAYLYFQVQHVARAAHMGRPRQLFSFSR